VLLSYTTVLRNDYLTTETCFGTHIFIVCLNNLSRDYHSSQSQRPTTLPLRYCRASKVVLSCESGLIPLIVAADSTIVQRAVRKLVKSNHLPSCDLTSCVVLCQYPEVLDLPDGPMQDTSLARRKRKRLARRSHLDALPKELVPPT
jgi:hypothetical protein